MGCGMASGSPCLRTSRAYYVTFLVTFISHYTLGCGTREGGVRQPLPGDHPLVTLISHVY